MADREEHLSSRVGALDQALRKCLEELTAQYGGNAKTKLRTIRDDLIFKLKQSDIPANRELDHRRSRQSKLHSRVSFSDRAGLGHHDPHHSDDRLITCRSALSGGAFDLPISIARWWIGGHDRR
jgi:hypothetical protein